jgi:hypothetical protein
MTVTDPVTAHVAELERVLRGPGRVRRSMIREVRDGLHDAVAAYRDCGLDPERAARRAVRDFGPIREIAPQFQAELAARQGRWTAALLMVVFPGMMLGWELVWRGGEGEHVGPTPLLALVLARVQDASATLVAAAAVALLAASFHRTAPPRVVTSLVGLVACVGAIVCGGTGVVMTIFNAPSAATAFAVNQDTVPAAVVSGLLFTLVMWSAVRTIRVARAIGPGNPDTTCQVHG